MGDDLDKTTQQADTIRKAKEGLGPLPPFQSAAPLHQLHQNNIHKPWDSSAAVADQNHQKKATALSTIPTVTPTPGIYWATRRTVQAPTSIPPGQSMWVNGRKTSDTAKGR